MVQNDCRDPGATLNEECAVLISCPVGEADKDTCESNECIWIESGDCNDPSFTGCYADPDEAQDVGYCPTAIEHCLQETKKDVLKIVAHGVQAQMVAWFLMKNSD